MPRTPSDLAESELLRFVVEGTVSETGTEFYRALVKNITLSLGMMGAWVTEYLPEEQRLRALAMWVDGHFVDHYEYNVAGTACEDVIESKSLVHIPDRLIELYPQDTDLVPLNAVSYLGMPLLDVDGSVLGHIGLLDCKPMPKDERAISLFKIFAARAAAEHRRIKASDELRKREQQLTRLFNGAMDAILVVDAALKIVRVNPAAERLFGCTAEDLLGETFKEFLVSESAAQMDTFADEIAQRPPGQQQIWIPQDFIVRRWDHSVFPAEVTLSRFEDRAEVFHTLILRNCDERLEADRRIRLLTQEADYLREAVRDVPGHGDLLGRSDCMRVVFDAIRNVAATDSTVLITGETGTGKELVARSTHRASTRSEKPLVLVNCAAIPANLIESEFFGHERGAFTGAVSRREGRFSLANGGTIFLDEVGELPMELQAKLLRVLQEGEFEPLGSTKTVKVDVRVIAATNRDLGTMVSEGNFREDLYFRLNVFPIHVPPLRERGRDVDQLAAEFAKRFARRMGKRIELLDDSQLRRLRGYNWPGNVRELQNVIERAVILSASHGKLALEHAMSGFEPVPQTAATTESDTRVFNASEIEEFERANIRRALEACDSKVSGDQGAARLLGIPASTLSSRMKALGIERPHVRA